VIRMLRTLRLDPSDTLVFVRAAEPGEWAVPGSVFFWNSDLNGLAGKERAAFRAGFVGLRSFGFSTLVEVAEIDDAELEALAYGLSRRLLDCEGAPGADAARQAADEEIRFARSLCDHPLGTVVAMYRSLEDGDVRERFRTLERRPEALTGTDRLHAFARAFEVLEVEEEPDERVDLTGLSERAP
jgi:hypothetical protein